MISLNLLPDVKRDFLKAKRDQARVVGVSVLVILVSVGVTVLLASWVYGAQTLHKDLLTASIKENTAKIESITDIDKYVTIQNQLSALSTLHDNRNNFSRLLTILPTLNPKSPNTIKLSSFLLDDTDALITMQGRANDFSGLVTFRDILQNVEVTYRASANASTTKEKLFNNVKIVEQNLSRDSSGTAVVSFKLTVKYNRMAFKTDSMDVTTSVPKLETTPSKQDTPSLFTNDPATSQGGGN